MPPEPDDTEPEPVTSGRRAELLALFLALLLATRDRLTADVTAYLSGTITLGVLTDRLVFALQDGHTGATVLGRQLAGVLHAEDEHDRVFARSIVDEQTEYLAGLVEDLQDGRYEPTHEADGGTGGGAALVGGALAARLALYALALRSTALEAWTLAQEPGTLIDWRLGAADHCAVCPELAAAGPYPANAMPTYPGAGDTPCLSRCDCEIFVVGGEEAFPFMSI